MIWYDTISSTSDVLLAMARQGAAHGTLLAAGRQTAGHGRGGAERPFFSPEGGLYCSVLMRTDLPPAGSLPITPRAALAVRRVLARYGCDVSIKWVNDLYRGERKAGGILTQMAGGACVIGVGLNLVMRDTPPQELQGKIAYCFAAPEQSPAPAGLAQEIADMLLQLCLEDSAALLEEYRAASAVLGREVIYEENGRNLYGTASDITPQGELILKDGKILHSGEVHLRLAQP